MPTQVATFLIPKNGAQWFILEDTYLRGGMRVTASIATRDVINSSCKKAGMLVWTQAESKLWQLQADLTTYLDYTPSSNSNAFYTHNQPLPADLWYIPHDKNSSSFVYNVYDDLSGVVIPDEVVVVDNSEITIRFTTPITGRCTLVFDLSPPTI